MPKNMVAARYFLPIYNLIYWNSSEMEYSKMIAKKNQQQQQQAERIKKWKKNFNQNVLNHQID